MEEGKPLHWIASSLKDLRGFGDDVKLQIGFALRVAQSGGTHDNAKPLHGFGGRGVLEIVADSEGDAYRGVYTVKFQRAIYVLHVFKKKSTKGHQTPKQDIDLIKSRLATAESHYNSTYGGKTHGKK